MTETDIYELKDTASVSLTEQLRAQLEMGKATGKTNKLVTGSETHVTQSVFDAFGEANVIQLPTLGPGSR